jgi:hypothetical protein
LDFSVVEHVLHVVQVFQHVDDLLHAGSVLARQRMVFSGRIVTSAISAFRPAASSAFFTVSKSPGAVITSMAPSSSLRTSSAPASSATSITLSSLVPGARISWPQCLNWKATEPSVPMLPPYLLNTWRTSATVRTLLSVMVSTMIAAPPMP